MATNQSGKGDVINITAATGGVTSGAIWEGTDCAGVYLLSATGGAVVPVAVEGIWTVTKVGATSGAAFTQGDTVYSVTTGGVNKAKNAGTIILGKATAAATTTATTVDVKITW